MHMEPAQGKNANFHMERISNRLRTIVQDEKMITKLIGQAQIVSLTVI